jgi:hypothetical protein
VAEQARAFVEADQDWDAIGARLVSRIEALATER